MDDMLKIRSDLPASLHPERCKGQGPAANATRHALRLCYEVQGKIVDLRNAKADPKLVLAGAIPAVEKATTRADNAIKSVGQQIEHLGKEINLSLQAGKVSDPAEIRNYWLAQGEGTFIKIGALFQKANDNLQTIAAVLGGPAYLSGITPQNQAALKDVAAKTLVPEKVAAREEAKNALAILEASASRFAKDVGLLLGGMKDNSSDLVEAAFKQE